VSSIISGGGRLQQRLSPFLLFEVKSGSAKDPTPYTVYLTYDRRKVSYTNRFFCTGASATLGTRLIFMPFFLAAQSSTARPNG